MRALVACGFVVGVLLLSGCGGSGSSGAPDADIAPTTTAPAPAPARTMPATTETLSGAFDPKEALFTIADLPTGWVEEGRDDDRNVLCDTSLFDTSSANEEVRFSNQGNVPQLVQRVGSFAPGDATAAMQRTREVFAACTTDEVDGVKWSVGATSIPALGDESFAYLATGETEGFRLAALFVGMRSGDAVVTTVYAEFGSVDTRTAVSYARKALDRLRAVQK